VTLEALVRQDRPDIPIEQNLLGGTAASGNGDNDE
jgi:hypothetical protein